VSKAFARTIQKNENNERPSRVIFADVESKVSDPVKGKQLFSLLLWTMVYKRYRVDGQKDQTTTHYGTTASEFWDIVDDYCLDKTKVYLTTHHLEVDFMPLQGFIHLPERGWKLDKLISHGRVLALFWSKGKRKLVVMNNGNLFDGSIEQWGKVLGIEKRSMPSDAAPLEEWYHYCIRDTEIVVAMWDNLFSYLDKHDLGNFRITKAGLALQAYKHRFITNPIAIHKDPIVLTLERSAYAGGRFQALQIGNFTTGNYYTLDITSMYGWIMAHSVLPYELRGYKETSSLDLLHRLMRRYAVIVQATVDIQEPIFPIHQDSKLTYPVGSHTIYLTTPELEYIIKNGWSFQLHRVAWYYKAKCLSAYANYFLQLKNEYELADNQPMRQLTKLYLNSLYGKLAQKGYKDKIIGTCDPDVFKFTTEYDLTTHIRYDLAWYGGQVHRTEVSESGYNTATSIAAHITALGRLFIWDLMQQAGLEHVYHVATDSLVVDEVGYKNLSAWIQPGVAGMLKVEHTYATITIKDVNDVVLADTVKIKGIPYKAIKVDEDSYTITAWTKLTTLLKQGVIDHYYTRLVTKTLKRERYYQALGLPNPHIKHIPQEQLLANLDYLMTLDEISLTEDKINAYKEARILPSPYVFTMYDYREGKVRELTSLHFKSLGGYKVGVDNIARDYGLDTIQQVYEEVLRQVQRDQTTQELQTKLTRLKRTAHAMARLDPNRSTAPPPQVNNLDEPIPW
jgi:hypothetical protein